MKRLSGKVDEIMPMAEVGAALGVSDRTAYKMCAEGIVPSHLRGVRRRIVFRGEFERWRQDGETPQVQRLVVNVGSKEVVFTVEVREKGGLRLQAG